MKSNIERNIDDIWGILHDPFHLMTTSLFESHNRIDVVETAFLFCNDASLSCLCLFFYYSQRFLNYLVFQPFDIRHTWWSLYQKHVMRSKERGALRAKNSHPQILMIFTANCLHKVPFKKNPKQNKQNNSKSYIYSDDVIIINMHYTGKMENCYFDSTLVLYNWMNYFRVCIKCFK